MEVQPLGLVSKHNPHSGQRARLNPAHPIYGKPITWRLGVFLTFSMFSGAAHCECVIAKYVISGSIRNSSGRAIPATVRFSWVEHETAGRQLIARTESSEYSAVLYFDPQSKADKTSGHLYKCDAVLNSVRYNVEAPNHRPLRGTLKLSGSVTPANFSLQQANVRGK